MLKIMQPYFQLGTLIELTISQDIPSMWENRAEGRGIRTARRTAPARKPPVMDMGMPVKYWFSSDTLNRARRKTPHTVKARAAGIPMKGKSARKWL